MCPQFSHLKPSTISQVRNFSRLPKPSERWPLSPGSFLDGSLQQSGHFHSQSLAGVNTADLLSLDGLTSTFEVSQLTSGLTCLPWTLLGLQSHHLSNGGTSLSCPFHKAMGLLDALYTCEPRHSQHPYPPLSPVFQVPGPNSNCRGRSTQHQAVLNISRVIKSQLHSTQF